MQAALDARDDVHPAVRPTLAELTMAAAEIDVAFSVDVFNEGLDVPAVDNLLMLRPTESPVVFLQQLGRGLRTHEGKDALQCIDFIGNHRSFLLKPRTLLSFGAPGSYVSPAALEAMASGGSLGIGDERRTSGAAAREVVVVASAAGSAEPSVLGEEADSPVTDREPETKL